MNLDLLPSVLVTTCVVLLCRIVKSFAQWAVPERIGAHSARKGSATHLTAGTLNPPPLPSVAHRGEWSQGTVQDIYFNFAQPGDHYIGRMLAGLDPNSTRFRVLPPHFKCGLENPHVKQALDMCFGRILKARKNLLLPSRFFSTSSSINCVPRALDSRSFT